jgi:hypothetical protein
MPRARTGLMNSVFAPVLVARKSAGWEEYCDQQRSRTSHFFKRRANWLTYTAVRSLSFPCSISCSQERPKIVRILDVFMIRECNFRVLLRNRNTGTELNPSRTRLGDPSDEFRPRDNDRDASLYFCVRIVANAPTTMSRCPSHVHLTIRLPFPPAPQGRPRPRSQSAHASWRPACKSTAPQIA